MMKSISILQRVKSEVYLLSEIDKNIKEFGEMHCPFLHRLRRCTAIDLLKRLHYILLAMPLDMESILKLTEIVLIYLKI